MIRRRSALRDLLIQGGWALIDATCWAVAVVFTVWLRYQFDIDEVLTGATLMGATVAAGLHVLLGLLLGPYLVRHVRGSFEEITALARAAFLSGLILWAWALLAYPVGLPRSVPPLAGGLALTAMMAARFVVRAWRSRRASKRHADARVIIYGAGLMGRRLASNMLHDDQSNFRPVAFIDDDRAKRKLRIEGVPVRGDHTAIGRVAHRFDATHLVLAIPSADSELIRQVHELGKDHDLHVKVLPTVDGMLGHQPHVQDLRDINLEDLLGRRPVELDEAALADQISGKVVLVTGAGGSIGSELCRQIARFRPDRLLMLDRDESALHATQLSMTGRGLLEGEDLLLADIRDRETMTRVFAKGRPDVVFHAAALKHLSLLERYPTEAWQTNVLGTLNILQAAAASGVGTFVNISTDKAASPTSVLGYSKRIAERLTAGFARSEPGRYVSVRFGNVLGSRGSVIPAFTEQIRRGGPVTVTHPDVERYFMLIPEACQLVLQAAAMGEDGDVMVLDMGRPIKIAEVAETLIEMSGRSDVEVVYTGLRPGEKLTEVLFGEAPQRATEHPMIVAVSVPMLSPSEVAGAPNLQARPLIAWLRHHANETHSPAFGG